MPKAPSTAETGTCRQRAMTVEACSAVLSARRSRWWWRRRRRRCPSRAPSVLHPGRSPGWIPTRAAMAGVGQGLPGRPPRERLQVEVPHARGHGDETQRGPSRGRASPCAGRTTEPACGTSGMDRSRARTRPGAGRQLVVVRRLFLDLLDDRVRLRPGRRVFGNSGGADHRHWCLGHRDRHGRCGGRASTARGSRPQAQGGLRPRAPGSRPRLGGGLDHDRLGEVRLGEAGSAWTSGVSTTGTAGASTTIGSAKAGSTSTRGVSATGAAGFGDTGSAWTSGLDHRARRSRPRTGRGFDHRPARPSRRMRARRHEGGLGHGRGGSARPVGKHGRDGVGHVAITDARGVGQGVVKQAVTARLRRRPIFSDSRVFLGRDEQPQRAPVDHELQRRDRLPAGKRGGGAELERGRAVPPDGPPLAGFRSQERDPVGVDDHREVADDGRPVGCGTFEIDVVHAEAPIPEPE